MSSRSQNTMFFLFYLHKDTKCFHHHKAIKLHHVALEDGFLQKCFVGFCDKCLAVCLVCLFLLSNHQSKTPFVAASPSKR